MKRVLTIAISFILVLSAVVIVPAINRIDTANATTESTVGVFDEDHIELSFGALTDPHINKAWGAENDSDFCTPYLRDAFNDLISAAAVHDTDGLDAIMITGDIIDNSVNANNQYGRDRRGVAEMNAFADVVLDYKDTSIGTNVMVTTGNHDTRTYYSSFGAFYDLLGAEYFEDDDNSNRTKGRLDLDVGYYHSYITKNGKNYHFIMIEPIGTIPWYYDPLALDYLEADLATITAEDPNAYVYLGSHIAMWDTIHGSEDSWDTGSNKWHTDGLMKDASEIAADPLKASNIYYVEDIEYIGMDGQVKVTDGFRKGAAVDDDEDGGSSSATYFCTRDIITKYPQVMVFSGHTHNTLVGERSIMQKYGFTSVNAGAVIGGGSYGYDQTPKSNTYADGVYTSHGENKQDYRKGVLIQIDVDGDVRLSRVDFSDNHDQRGWSLSKTPWELARPETNGSNLTKYDYDGRLANNVAPTLDGTVTFGDVVNATDNTKATANVSFNYAKTNDVDEVAYYIIKIYNGETLVETIKVRSDYVFAHIGTGLNLTTGEEEYRNNLPTTFSQDITIQDGWKVTVQAFDEWNAGSEIIEGTYTAPVA